jgi:hypothetical protein
MSFRFASWVILVLIGFRHPFMRYWQPLEAKTTVTRSLPHLENECEWTVNCIRYCIVCNPAIVQIFVHITDVLTASISKNPIYER